MLKERFYLKYPSFYELFTCCMGTSFGKNEGGTSGTYSSKPLLYG
jgi:hypothetical protein